MSRLPSTGPYRAATPPCTDSTGGGCPDADLLPVLVPFWLVSVARGIGTPDALGAMAAIVAVFLPLLLRAALAWYVRRLAHSLFRRYPTPGSVKR